MNLVFQNTQWLLPIGLALVLLFALAWFAWPRERRLRRGSVLPLALRAVGILTIAFALANPHLIRQRPTRGANAVALVADNSEGLRILDSGAVLDRGERIRQALAGRDSGWLASLAETYQVRNYRFDRGLARTPSFEALDFKGDRSNMNSALRSLRERSGDDAPVAILLFTDGVASDPELSDSELAELPPVFPIVAGTNRPPPDVALQSVTVAESAFEDAPLQIHGAVSSDLDGQPGVELSLRLLDGSDDQVAKDVITSRIRPTPASAETPFSLQWPRSASGLHFYELQANAVSENPDAAPAEATRRNNRRLLVSHIGKERYRILYVTGRPNWEYKFLNRALAEDPQIDFVGLIRVANREPKFEFKGRSGESSNPLFRGFGREDETERYDQPVLVRLNTRDDEELRGGFPQTAEELFRYDAVILDDLEADFFSYSQQGLLRDFVSERGGGLLVLGGAESLENGNYGASALASALPVIFGADDDAGADAPPVRFELTREGWVSPWLRLRDSEGEERERQSRMTAFSVVNALRRPKPAAQTVAVAEDVAGQRMPAMVTQPYGAGRVACLAIGDLWRWGMQDEAQRDDLNQFWRQTCRWLVSDARDRVTLDIQLLPGQGVRLLANARTAEYRPLELGKASLSIERVDLADDETKPGFTAARFEMTPVSGTLGQFESTIPLLDEGAYRATVTVTDSQGLEAGVATNGWVAQPAVAEYASITPDRPRLERIAKATGGAVLSFGDLDQIAARLSRLPATRTETVSEPIWHRSWIFLLAAACLLAEWAIRRRKGLA